MCDCYYQVVGGAAVMLLCILLIVAIAKSKQQPPKVGIKSVFKRIDAELKGVQPFSYFEMNNIPELKDHRELSLKKRMSISDQFIKRKVSACVTKSGTVDIFYVGESDGSVEHITRAIIMYIRLSPSSCRYLGYPLSVTITEEMKDDLLVKHNIIVSLVDSQDKSTHIYFKR